MSVIPGFVHLLHVNVHEFYKCIEVMLYLDIKATVC